MEGDRYSIPKRIARNISTLTIEGIKDVAGFEELKLEYQSLFDTCKIRVERADDANQIVDRIIKNESRYRITQAATGVPWSVIALIHSLESSLNFSTHLHNGDPLTAKTTRVPQGRPPGNAPFTWEESAADALQFDGLTSWQNWSIPGVLFRLEKFNGMGYRKKGISTPYLWSFSNHYSKGKFVRDGVFDENAVSQQCGAAVLLKILLDREIDLGLETQISDSQTSTRNETMTLKYPGRIIRIGETDTETVRPIQLRLNELGCGPLQGTGFFGQKTEAAVKLFQARFPDLQGQPLLIDGEIGPLTWGALFGKAPESEDTSSSDLLTKVLAIARSQIGVMEEPRGSNGGLKVSQYLRSVGLGSGYAWCVAFQYWCFQEAATALGTSNPMIKTAGVLDHWNQAGRRNIPRITTREAQNDPAKLKPGMIFTIDVGDPGGLGHAGFVEKVVDGRLVTIEGNTNTGGSREGIGVFRRDARKLKDINVGFIDYSSF
jgi:lysozyme family protein